MKKEYYIDPGIQAILDSGTQHVTIHSEFPDVAEVEDYAKKTGHNVKTTVGNAMDMIQQIEPNDTRALVYVNGGYLYRQRPSLANAIKKKLPNSTVLMDFIDFFTDGQHRQDVREELEREYGIRNGRACLEDVIDAFKQKVNYKVTFNQYAEFPRKAFVVAIEGKK